MSTAEDETPAGTREREAIEYAADSIAGENEEHEVEWVTNGPTPSDEYRFASVPGKIGRYLIEHIPAFEQLGRVDFRFVYRNKKDWMKDGRPQLGECRMMGGINEFFSECKFVITVNYRAWIHLNAWQRVALIYHELRHADVDDEGKTSTNPHDYEVFADELELFGARTFHSWMNLARGVDAAQQESTQYDLPLLSVVQDEDSGIDSITVSSGESSVTIRRGGRRRQQRELAGAGVGAGEDDSSGRVEE